MKGDLHCHTKLSDGSEGIEDVISMAKRIGLDFVSITDHDTLKSYSRAQVLSQRYGVGIIRGVEFSTFDMERKRKVHILCYLPLKPDRLEGICIRIGEQRKRAGNEMAKKVMKKYPITPEAITKYSAGSTAIYKQHIIRALFDAGFTDRIYGDLYKKLFDSREGRCLVKMEYPNVFDVVELIHSAGGIAVFAHPTVYHSMDLVEEMVEKHLIDGIEIYHPRNSEEDSAYLLDLAQRNHLIITGGSDFHGMYSSGTGHHLGSKVTMQESLDKLFALSDQLKEKVR